MYKTHQCRTTFGSWHVEKSARRCGAKHISKSKCTKHLSVGPLLEVDMSKKVHAVVARSTFLKTPHARTTFEGSDVVLRGRRKGFCTLPKMSKSWKFCSNFKSTGGRGTFEEDLERCMSRGRRSARDMLIRDVRRSGRWFPEMGCILEHQIFRFAEMILRDRCSTSYDLASLFRGWRSTLDRWSGSNRTTHWHEAVSSALNFPFLKEVSQNCLVFDVVNLENWGSLAEFFVFDVVNFENWGSLAELLPCWCCQVLKLRKSRRKASFSSLQIDR